MLKLENEQQPHCYATRNSKAPLLVGFSQQAHAPVRDIPYRPLLGKPNQLMVDQEKKPKQGELSSHQVGEEEAVGQAVKAHACKS